ncbi:unnamed protein product [Strongylus vulgaris]|uniref:Uncharacterized protein n=1 Tax=Strongylus vulgaris TaxID=40348 RepID=A0A3P7JRL5_STRVU|nr:unnamed protein product [Strongylus vulgaris]
MDGLSDEERAHIEAVMAMAERDQAPSALSPGPPRKEMEIPPGLEDLSEEERQQILAVMAAAEAESVAPPSPQIRRSGSAMAVGPSSSTFPVRDMMPERSRSAMDRPVEPKIRFAPIANKLF